jgi:hypothetical protein
MWENPLPLMRCSMRYSALFLGLVAATVGCSSGAGDDVSEGADALARAGSLLYCSAPAKDAKHSAGLFLKVSGSSYSLGLAEFQNDELSKPFESDTAVSDFVLHGASNALTRGGALTGKASWFGATTMKQTVALTLDAPARGKTSPTTGTLTVTGTDNDLTNAPVSCTAEAAIAANSCLQAAGRAAIKADNDSMSASGPPPYGVDNIPKPEGELDGELQAVHVAPSAGGFDITYNVAVLQDRDHNTWGVVMHSSGGTCTTKAAKMVDSYD